MITQTQYPFGNPSNKSGGLLTFILLSLALIGISGWFYIKNQSSISSTNISVNQKNES